MADNETEGSNGSFRQNQGSRKRRGEPPIIDAKATDVSQPAEETPAVTDPEPAPLAQKTDGETAESEEPVLFGQVLRGAAPSAKAEESSADGGADPAVEPSAFGSMSAEPVTPSAPTPPSETASGSSFDDLAAGRGRGDSDEPPTSAPPVSPPPKRSSATMLLGVVVAVLLAIIAGLLFAGPQRGAPDDMRAALDEAKTRIGALEARPDASALTAQIAALEQRTSGDDAEIAALKTTTEDLAARLKEMPPMPAQASEAAATPAAPNPAPTADAATPASPAPPSADLAALSGRLDDLTHKVDALPSQAPAAVDLSPVDDKIAGLEKRLDAMQTSVIALPKVDLGPITSQISDLNQRISTVDHAIVVVSASVAALPTVDLDPLKAGLASVDQRLAPIETALSAPKAGDRTTEARAVGSADVAQAAPLAVVAQAASRGIDDGRPLVVEVDALKALGVDEASLAPLSAVAVKGAPTLAGLEKQWTDLEPDVLATMRPTGGSLLDRFTAGARQIVSVRRVGAPAGEDPTSVAGRVSAAMEDGRVAEALAQWAKLPDAGRNASQVWADAARGRLDAEAAARGLASRAIETLAKAKG